MIADLDEPNPIQISAAAPTIVSWIAEPKSRRYDVIRGDLASLQESGGVVDLGAVVCVEDDSVDPDTVGNEDPDVPLPGQGYFFLYRGTQGLSDGPGTYDRGSSGLERTATVGDCIE